MSFALLQVGINGDQSVPKKARAKRRFIIPGEQFGLWTVLERGRTENGKCKHLCVCKCGTRRWVDGKNLRQGVSASCGCAEPAKRQCPHGESRQNGKGSPEYRSWRAMRSRCYEQRSVGFPNYGGKGIVVCERWRSSYENFLTDMGRKPTPEHTIDRKDPNLSYTCGHCGECSLNGWTANCRWADDKTQRNNRTNSKFLEFQGKCQTMAQWAEELGLSKKTLKARLGKYRWDVERALTTPVKGGRE
jgi:hypothetical protein